MTKKKRLLLLVVGVITIIFISFLFLSTKIFNIYFYSDHNKDILNNSLGNIIPDIGILPSINETDIFGKLRKTNDFKGNFVYIQFVKKQSSNIIGQIHKLLNIYEENKDFKVILFIEDYKAFAKEFVPDNDEIIISNKYLEYEKIFKAPKCCEVAYLYNKSGLIVTKRVSPLDVGTINSILMRYVAQEIFNIKTYVSISDNKEENLLFGIIKYIKNQNSKYYIIHLSNHICKNCKSGLILNEMNLIYKSNNIMKANLILLIKNINENDKLNLINSFNIRYPVFIAYGKADILWQKLIDHYGDLALNNIVILFNALGEILKVFDYECNCENTFFKQLSDIINKDI